MLPISGNPKVFISSNFGRLFFYCEKFTNPLWANVSFLYLLEASENLWFSDVSSGYKNVTAENGLKYSQIILLSKKYLMR